MEIILLGLLMVWFISLIIPLWALGVSILFIKQLSDDPKNPKKPYFYTAIEPGRIKAVLRGGKVIKYLMNFPGHFFPWELTKDEAAVQNDESWQIEKIDDHRLTKEQVESLAEKYEHFKLLNYLVWFTPWGFWTTFSWFKGVVFNFTGHRWVGLYWFQSLYIYRFTRKIQKLDASGNPETNTQGLPVLVDSSEMTDHVRARTFVRQSSGQEMETVEGLKTKTTWVAEVFTINPQKALFGTDRWDVVLDSAIIRTLVSITRTMPINQVVTATKKMKDELSEQVLLEVNEKLAATGLRLESFNIVDFDTNFSEEDRKAFTAKWRAGQNKEAARIEGEGRGAARAAEITKVAEAIRTGGDEAKRAQELEAQIAIAEAVGRGGGVAIIGSQDGKDAINAALLAELKKINRKERKS